MHMGRKSSATDLSPSSSCITAPSGLSTYSTLCTYHPYTTFTDSEKGISSPRHPSARVHSVPNSSPIRKNISTLSQSSHCTAFTIRKYLLSPFFTPQPTYKLHHIHRPSERTIHPPPLQPLKNSIPSHRRLLPDRTTSEPFEKISPSAILASTCPKDGLLWDPTNACLR